MRDGEGTLAGAVYDPNRDELFSATRDARPTLAGARDDRARGARRPDRRGRRRRTAGGSAAPRRRPRDGDGRHRPRLRRRTCARRRRGCSRALVPRVRDIRRFGSAALDLTWTAAGRYDAYFERTVKQWDIAAGALICERAGLRVLELPVHEHLPWGILVAPAGAGASRCWSWSADREPALGTLGSIDAAGGIRTHTPFRTGPFEGPASTVPPPPQCGRRASEDICAGAQAGCRRRVGVARPRRPPGRGARARRSSPGRSRAWRTRRAASARGRSAA